MRWNILKIDLKGDCITRAFETLMIEAVKKRSAVVAERRRRVSVGREFVLVERRVCVRSVVYARTHERDELVAPFVNHEWAHLTLQAFYLDIFKLKLFQL